MRDSSVFAHHHPLHRSIQLGSSRAAPGTHCSGTAIGTWRGAGRLRYGMTGSDGSEGCLMMDHDGLSAIFMDIHGSSLDHSSFEMFRG